MATAYLALGSNLGDRRANLEAALAALRGNTAVRVLAVSGFIETEPVGGPPGQGSYLNGAAAVETDLEPCLNRFSGPDGRNELLELLGNRVYRSELHSLAH